MTRQNKTRTRAKHKKKDVDDWLKLDNAAMIYPSAASDKWNAVYRLSVYLKEEVDPLLLDQALKSVIERFPGFNVHLRRGLFWFFFQKSAKEPSVEPEKTFPCRPILFKSDRHLFRVLFFKNKIALEVFHAVSDGYGSMQFLCTLVAKYLSLKGVKFDPKKCQINFNDKPTEEELEDSHKKYADLSCKNKWKEKKAYQVNGTKVDRGSLNVITGILPLDKLKEQSKLENATITEFLAAVYFKALLENQREILIQKRPIKISVPVNLRRFFKSDSLRNFSSYINISMQRKDMDLSFSQLIEKVKEQMKKVEKENLLKNINSNVGAQRNIWVRMAPLFLKNVVLKGCYSNLGEKLYSTVLSNLGKVELPDEIASHIERFEVLVGQNKINNVNLGVMSFRNNLTVSFSSLIRETKIMKLFFIELTERGIPVRIETNLN